MPKPDSPHPRLDPIHSILLLLACLIFLLLLVLFSLHGMRSFVTPLPSGTDALPRKAAEEIRWVSYGDSITDHGFWQPLVLERFAFQHTDLGISGTCVAGNGATAYWAEARIQEITAAAPDLVTIMGGINDFYTPNPIGDPDEMKKLLEAKDRQTFYGAYSYLIERLQAALPAAEIMILSTTPVVTRYAEQPANALGESIDDFAEASRQIAAFYGLVLVDTAAIPYSGEAEFMADHPDGVHPNLEGAKKIAALVKAAIWDNLNLQTQTD